MSTGDERHTPPPSEDRLLSRVRLIAAGIVLLCVVLLVISSIVNSHVDTAIFGMLIGALLVLLGFEVPSRWPGRRE